MSEQIWDWRAALKPEERTQLEEIENMIKWLDQRRLFYAARRIAIQNRGAKRARRDAASKNDYCETVTK